MSKFLERHKRKSLLAALLLIFQGRAKYIAVALVVVALSVPFAVSGDMLNKFLELPPVVSLLKSVGLGSVLSSINPNYTRDLVKSALARASEDSDKYSLWQKIFGTASGGANGQGTVGMVRAGEDWDKISKGRGGGPIKGVVSDEEIAKGQGADALNFEDMLAMGEGGMGDMAFGSGGGSDYGPYMNRNYIKGPGTAGKNEGMFNSAYGSANIPEPRDPKTGKIRNAKKMGRLSGFSWKNVGYRAKGSSMDVRINSNRRALFQASEAFTMTSAAYKQNPSYETQASYVGSTYDGNEVNADVVTTDGAPSLPDSGFTGSLMTSAGAWSDMAEKCAKANETESAKISQYQKEQTDLAPKLKDRPKCCKHSAVDNYNNNVVEKMRELCKKINTASANLGAACQNSNPQQYDCGKTYDDMRVSKCSKWKCWLGVILGVLLIIIGALLTIFTAGIGAAIGVGLIVAGAGLLIGQILGGAVGAIFSIVAGIVAMVFAGPVAAIALGVASWVSSEALKKWGPEDGSSAVDTTGDTIGG
ncbi:MAG: DUF308 domain-containing protein [Elusimicrobiota bacterium]